MLCFYHARSKTAASIVTAPFTQSRFGPTTSMTDLMNATPRVAGRGNIRPKMITCQVFNHVAVAEYHGVHAPDGALVVILPTDQTRSPAAYLLQLSDEMLSALWVGSQPMHRLAHGLHGIRPPLRGCRQDK